MIFDIYTRINIGSEINRDIDFAISSLIANSCLVAHRISSRLSSRMESENQKGSPEDPADHVEHHQISPVLGTKTPEVESKDSTEENMSLASFSKKKAFNVRI